MSVKEVRVQFKNKQIKTNKQKMKKLINLKEVDHTKEPIFFGEELNLERYDRFRYPNYFEMFRNQIRAFWTPEEVDVTKDKLEYKTLTDHEKFIFTSNLKYQILLDSVQARGIPHLTENLSNPEVEAFCSWWAAFEQLHSYSYTHVIKNVYSNPSEIFDNILNNDKIINRTVSVTKHYDSIINSIPDESIEDKRKKLLLTLVSINILEGVRFYVSFACSFAFAENGKMEGNAKIIKFIARDEMLHLGFTQHLLRTLKTKKEEGFVDTWKELEPTIIQMYKDAAKEEMDWADYLFEGGSMLGLNAEILQKYMRFLVNDRMKAIGLEGVFEKTKNPIPWINTWLSNDAAQPAPQETEITSYNVGAIKSDLGQSDFSDFDF